MNKGDDLARLHTVAKKMAEALRETYGILMDKTEPYDAAGAKERARTALREWKAAMGEKVG